MRMQYKLAIARANLQAQKEENEGLRKYIQKLTNDLKANTEPAAEVPCSGVLWSAIVSAPKDRTPILIYTDYKKMATAYWNGESWTDWMRPQHTYGSVTHWMNLPKAP